MKLLDSKNIQLSIKISFYVFFLIASISAFAQKPNVIIILADDVGYGDLGCHGNTLIKTPNLNTLHDKSIRLTNFHVGTTCAPSRAMILTGKDNNSVGVWHTINGREILNKEENIMPQFFKEAGYRTGIFGKWHLGDNYPFRPQDRGFDEVLIHGGGGVGQTPDFWGNDYFTGTYLRNGKPEKFKKYCDDVWFDEAIKFIEKSKDNPFFCYIPTNIAHSPYIVAPEYSNLYANNKKIVNPEFYGMITKMDENIGKLISYLKESKLDSNTIIIFLSDNGTAGGGRFDKNGYLINGYNSNLRGMKSSVYEGGHKVPFFVHIPFGNFANKEINALASGTDLLPTLLDLCGIVGPKSNFDGLSLLPALSGNQIKDRVLIVDTQRGEYLTKKQPYSVMTNRWRLVNGNELYDIILDPGQRNNLSLTYPDTLISMQNSYEKWWKKVSVQKSDYQRVIIGHNSQKEVCLTSHDLHVENGIPAWNQKMVKNEVGSNGFLTVEFQQSGIYKFELRRFPRESKEKIPSKYKNVLLTLGDDKFSDKLKPNSSNKIFTVKVDKGEKTIKTFLFDDTGHSVEAAYIYIKRKSN
jgi:arylsulfatase A-like enzyme